MKINLIPYKNSHRGYIWQTYVDSMKHHIEKIWGWDLAWQEDNFTKTLDKCTTAVIMLDGNQVGYIQYLKNSKHIHINMIILQAEYQSQGIGPELLKMVGKVEPSLPIQLNCFKVNVAAYNFYLNNGFKVIKTDNDFYTLSFNH